MKKRAVMVAVLFSVLFIGLGCHKETEQDKVKKVITDCQKAVEGKDVKRIITSLSKTYRDPQGFDYDSIKGLLLGYFFRHQKISVYISGFEVTVEDTAAKAVFQAVLTGGNTAGSASDLLPEALGIYAFEVSLRKESGDWMISSAKWEREGEVKGN